MKKNLLTILFFTGLLVSTYAQNPIELQLSDTYQTGLFDEGAAEIVAFDPQSNRVFFSNAFDNSFEIIDITNPLNIQHVGTIDLSVFGGGPNSIIAWNGNVAVAVEDTLKTANGKVLFFDINGVFQNQVIVGPLPDMLTISTVSQKIVVANEGEPNDDYTVDPEGSVSLIDYSGGIANLSQTNVTNVSFGGITQGDLDASVRIFGNNGAATIAQDMEPEYVALNHSGDTAYVVCQENNAIIVIDVMNATIVDIHGLGYKDHSLAGNGFDASNSANSVQITTHPVLGMYLPDAIAYYQHNGNSYVFTANEGDSRDYDGYSEEDRVRDLVLDSATFPNAAFLQNDTVIGRLNTTLAQGDTDGDNDWDVIYSYGARSFSVYRMSDGTQTYDSGDDFEQITLQEIPAYFNSNNDDNSSFKSRSDDKGPEPEAITIGRIGTRDFVFIALERVGGIFVYEIINPSTMTFIEYVNNRNFAVPADSSAAGDLGPEDLLFIPAGDSPNGNNLLLVSNEVSGSVSVYTIQVNFPVGLENSMTNTDFGVYPNPGSGNTIHFTKAFTGSIYCSTGKYIASYENADAIDISDLQPGLYIIKNQEGDALRFIRN